MYQVIVEKTEYIAHGPSESADFWAVLCGSPQVQSVSRLRIAGRQEPQAQQTQIFNRPMAHSE